MRVFVTGGSGFVGRNLIAALLARGDEVRALARSENAVNDAKARRELGYDGRMTHEQGFAEMRG